jgi:murein DD-endopeptidase MepM/ murein hydrolase activator NlpD
MSPKSISIRLSTTLFLLVTLGVTTVPLVQMQASSVDVHLASSSSSVFSGVEDHDRLLSRLSSLQEFALLSPIASFNRDVRSMPAQGGPDDGEQSDNWRTQTLSPEALKAVMQESLESAAKANELRANLQAIHDQLRERTMTQLQKRMDALRNDEQLIAQEQERLLNEQQEIDATLLAFDRITTEMLAKRNSDSRLYKRILEREQELHILDGMLETQTKKSENGLVDIPLTEEEVARFSSTQALLRAQLALMRDGVPDDIALLYLKKKSAADDARAREESVRSALERKESTLLEVRSNVTALAHQLDRVLQKTVAFTPADTFVWPVSGAITAGFFDKDYEHVFGVPHRAIDIATRQSSPVHAITDGVVYAVHDGGLTGYSYVLLGHANGYSSLYGHVSQFLVRAGETVSAGQVIALSGGTPGTHGAGHMTTGAHLHVEVMKDGVHIDPRTVLPAGK